MSEPRIKFARLRQLLADLGLREVVMSEAHVAFCDEKSDTLIVLPVYKTTAVVAPRHLAVVRTLLDGKGLLEGEEFDRLLAADSVKQSASS